ncbi:hypothetical protein ACFL6U_11610 [Planctomycetota bacterium]
MKNILAAVGRFFETHVEKIVLLVVLVICLYVVLMHVLLSPNSVELDGRKHSAATIDDHIRDQYVDALLSTLGGQAEPLPPYVTRLSGPIADDDPVREGVGGDLSRGFDGLVNGSLGHLAKAPIDLGPRKSPPKGTSERYKYKLPDIGDVWDAELGYIRAAAYVPTQELSDEVAYSEANPEPNDIDLVTVQARFNAASLFRRFDDSFAGRDLPETWRNEDLAKPVIGAVDLQRQALQPDGSWSDWQSVPRIAIENRRQLFAMFESVDELPAGGVERRLVELGYDPVQADLLQPLGYSMASAHEKWYPPEFHDEYVSLYAKQKSQERREERDAERDRTGTGRRGEMAGGGAGGYGGMETRGRGNTRSRSRSGADDMAAYGGYGEGGMTGTGTGRGRGTTRRRNQRPGADPTMDGYGGYGEMMGMGTGPMTSPMMELDQKFNDISLGRGKDLAEESELLFWAHDDTVVPGTTYRYRIRVGVLNPVAGTHHLDDAFLTYQNQALLWSTFSEVTPSVHIPKRQFFFARGYKEGTGTVEVEVKKYMLGYWRSAKFNVQPGDVIGRVEETEAGKEKRERMNTMGGGAMMMEGYGYAMGAQGITDTSGEPDEVDFTTNAVLLGTTRTDAWTGTSHLRPQIYYNMLYTRDGVTIEHTPVGSLNWPDEISTINKAIAKEERIEKEPFQSFNDGGRNNNNLMMDPFGGAYGGEEGYGY